MKREPYSESELARMQQDAIRRVHEMQRRAEHTVQEANRTLTPASPPANVVTPPHSAPEIKTIPTPAAPRHVPVSIPQLAALPPPQPAVQQAGPAFFEEKTQGGLIDKIIHTFDLDTDRLIVLLLIIVLLNEECDISLLLALGYIMM